MVGLLVFVFVVILFPPTRCHCPHLAKLHKPEGPSAPSHLPPGDKGWDWDETAAPGSMPEEYFIQTSLVQRATTGEERDFATKLEENLKRLQERLRREARVTIDNENIDCAAATEHYRCSDFPPFGPYHFLVVEDSSTGAAIYSVDRRHNSRNDGAIEMALLDALSRHSPSPLTVYASKTAEKEVGFVRRLSAKELQSLNARPVAPLPRRSPIELKLFEPKVLELRSTDGLEDVPNSRLIAFSSQEEFDAALKDHANVIVLFWNNVDSVSVHVFNIWARLSARFLSQEILLTHVECHKHGAFCTGLGPRDFRTIVAYQYGVNVASTDRLGDEEYYDKWIKLVTNGPIVQLKDETDALAAKKGNFLDSSFPAVTLATFGDDASAAFKHYKIAAERLLGRYALAYRLQKGTADSVSTFRPQEKKKRIDYDGRFDPSSLISFIAQSSEPTFIDISEGFSTDALFHQSKDIILFEGSEEEGNLEKIISEEIKKRVIMTRHNSQEVKMAETLKLNTTGPIAILFKKENVAYTFLDGFVYPEDLSRWIKNAIFTVTLSQREIHPLRLFQILGANNKFGKQEIILLPDHSLFEEVSSEYSNAGGIASQGCPFFTGGGAALNHDEL